MYVDDGIDVVSVMVLLHLTETVKNCVFASPVLVSVAISLIL